MCKAITGLVVKGLDDLLDVLGKVICRPTEVIPINGPKQVLLPASNAAAAVMRLFSSVRLSVYLSCPCSGFEGIHLEASFLICWYVFSMSRTSSYVKVIGSRSRSQEQNGIYERN